MVLVLISSVVTDLELTASQTVKTILLLILLVGGLLNVFWAYRALSIKKKISRIMIALFLFVISIPVLRWYDIEHHLLNYEEYAVGTTLGPCEVFARGAGVQFAYEVGGVEYQNCNTYHPIKKEEITSSGGKYYVRFSRKYADKGRMDFDRQAK